MLPHSVRQVIQLIYNSEKIIKSKNSVTGVYESVFIYSILISYQTDCYQDDCSYYYVHNMFAPI